MIKCSHKSLPKACTTGGTSQSLLQDDLFTSTNEIQHTSVHGFIKTYQWVRNGTMLPQLKIFVYISSTTYQKGTSIIHAGRKIWPPHSCLRDLKFCTGLQVMNAHASLVALHISKLEGHFCIWFPSVLVSKIGVNHQIPTLYEVPTASRAHNMRATILRRGS